MRLRRILLLCGVVALATAPIATAKSYDHPLIEQTFRLLPDGDAAVEEVRAFDFQGSFSWAEITRRTRGQYGRYGLDYEGVWDADTRQPLRYDVSRSGDDVTLKWYYAAQDQTKRFLLRYRIRRAVQRYSDVAQFYWQAVEGDHAPIGRVRITIEPPHPSPKLFKVFIHSRAAPGDLSFAEDFSRARVAQDNIPETSFVELRVLLDPALFPGAAVQSGQTHEGLLKDERGNSRKLWLLRNLIPIGFALAGLLLVGLILGFLWTYVRYGREPDVEYTAIYEREPPRKLPPAVLPAIMTQSKVQNRELPRAFAATLLEAARFGYLEIEETQDRGVLGTGLFKDTDLVYRLTDKGQALLSGGTVERGPDERPLLSFEVAVLEAVFRKAGAGGAVTSDQIEAWGKKIVGSKSNFLRFIEGWGPALRSWFEASYFKLDDQRSERAKAVFIGITVGALVLIFFVGLGLSLFIAGPVGAVLIGLAVKGLSRRTPEAALEVKRWEAFRRFMTDFSAMKDAGPRLLGLWEYYLVYATALGVAERLLENLKLVAAELNQTISTPRWFHSPSTGRGLPTSISSFESLTRSFQNFQNLSRALSTSSSSGGGFSGGGGGGGGGGGSRAG
jgi:uncharacterized membrane protein